MSDTRPNISDLRVDAATAAHLDDLDRIATSLLGTAVDLAERSGVTAIEGFPLAGTKRRFGGSDLIAGVEPLFEQAGFTVVHRPSDSHLAGSEREPDYEARLLPETWLARR